MLEIARSIFLLSGSIFIFIGAIGILNMPDTLCRSHALSKAITLGISLMLLSFLMNQSAYAYGTKVFLAIVFQFITIPLAGHIFALFSYESVQSKRWD